MELGYVTVFIILLIFRPAGAVNPGAEALEAPFQLFRPYGAWFLIFCFFLLTFRPYRAIGIMYFSFLLMFRSYGAWLCNCIYYSINISPLRGC